MEYQQCTIGRTFVARLHEGESIYDEIELLAKKEGIRCASVLAVGGIRKGKVITGPSDPDDLKNSEPLVEEFDDARELVGVGTIFLADGIPNLHFHGAMGRRRDCIVGCPREEAVCFLILEVVIIEWIGLYAERVKDPETGFSLLSLLVRE